MGTDDRDDYRSRGQAPRRRGAYEGSEPSAGRSYQRGRSGDYDDQASSRSSSRRDYGRDDDPRSGSRYERGGSGGSGGSGGYDRRPRNEPSGASRRPRNDDDPSMRRDRRGPDQYTRGGAGRGPRPPMRDDWETSARPRGGPRSPSPADSGARRRGGAAVAPSRGGGLWGDEPMGATGMRRGMVDPRDPRARRGQVEEEEESSGAAGFGKALVAIVLALAIGAGAAYGYYIFSTPKAPAGTGATSPSPTSGSSGSSGVSHASYSSHPQPLPVANAASRSFTLVVAG